MSEIDCCGPEEQTRLLRVLAAMIAMDELLTVDIENHPDWPSNISASAFVGIAADDLDRLRYALRNGTPQANVDDGMNGAKS